MRWGIECTRAYQQALDFDGIKFVSTDQIRAKLEKLAERIERKTRPMRRREYVLHLGVPYLFDSSGKRIPFKESESRLTSHICKHIKSGSDEKFRAKNILLVPGRACKYDKSNPSWKFYIEPTGGPNDIEASVRQTLLDVVKRKKDSLSLWEGEWDKRWLLLFNLAPHAENEFGLVKKTLEELFNSDQMGAKCDGVFWIPQITREVSMVPLYGNHSADEGAM